MEIPTKVLVDDAIQLFNMENEIVEQALSKLFSLFPKNTDESEVLLKVVTLNRLYSTQILAIGSMARHIFQNHEFIDDGIITGSADVVDRIATIEIQGKVRNCFSFATKYCNWHRDSLYPIYDSRVDWYLWHMQKQCRFSENFRKNEFANYSHFRDVVSDFREKFQLQQFRYKDLDKFFWLHGVPTDPASPQTNRSINDKPSD